jgi:hypothetical protein
MSISYLPAAGSITTSTPNTNGILGGYATVERPELGDKYRRSIGAFTAYQPFETRDDHRRYQQLAGDRRSDAVDNLVTNSLKLGNASASISTPFNLSLTSGGVLFTGTTFGAITGTGTLSGAPPLRMNC